MGENGWCCRRPSLCPPREAPAGDSSSLPTPPPSLRSTPRSERVRAYPFPLVRRPMQNNGHDLRGRMSNSRPSLFGSTGGGGAGPSSFNQYDEERENDRAIDDIANRAAALKRITIDIQEEAEQQQGEFSVRFGPCFGRGRKSFSLRTRLQRVPQRLPSFLPAPKGRALFARETPRSVRAENSMAWQPSLSFTDSVASASLAPKHTHTHDAARKRTDDAAQLCWTGWAATWTRLGGWWETCRGTSTRC